MADYKSMSDDYIMGNLTLDLSSSDLLTDTIKIEPLDSTLFNWNSSSYIVSAGSAGSGTYSVGVTGAQGSNYTYSTSGWNGISGAGTTASVMTSTKGIEISNGADITINGKSLSSFMDKVEERLGILQPKPELLEKFEALKQAYEHYKTLEALCMGDIPKDPNGKK